MSLASGVVLPYFGQHQYVLGYHWAYVQEASGTYGYVRSDCYVLSDASGKRSRRRRSSPRNRR